MVQVLLGQGASLEGRDAQGWTALHSAAHAGHLAIVDLLVRNGASTSLISLQGHSPLWYAAQAGHFEVTTYLLRQKHNTHSLLDDKDFCYNLMEMGKNRENRVLEDFVFVSPAPCYTAALLSALFREAALKEKDRAADLLEMGDVCEELNKDLVAIGKLLKKVQGVPQWFDIL